MANQVVLKKSSVAARVPVPGDLQFGELALNYADGILYYKKSDGTTIGSFTSGGGGGGATSVTLADTPPASPSSGTLWWDSNSGQLYIYYQDANSSQWVPASVGDRGPGVQPGGTTGQLLVKASNNDYDTQWVTNNSVTGFEQTFLLMGA